MRRREGIYTTKGGKEKLVAVKAIVNDVLVLAWVKDGRLISYEPWSSISEQMLTGPYLVFNI